MERHSMGGTEAERWVGMAEKLLHGRDLEGCRTFAIRARESDPTFESARRIIAVADTIIAGERRINDQRDWYAILQLSDPTHDPDLSATQYRRIGLLLNPIRNQFALAEEALKLVADAWSVLSNPSKKSLYDNELNRSPLAAMASGSGRGGEHHQQQQQQQRVRRSPRKSGNSANVEKHVTEESGDKGSRFWTACPYCYTMYEYARVYEDCTLRCQICLRAFHAVMIPPPPPPISDGEEAYFFCWGFYPLAVPMSYLEKKEFGASDWAPFSPMFSTSQFVDQRNVGGQNADAAAPKPKSGNARKSSAPKIYVDDDDDVFVEVSESSVDDSDVEWGTREKKKARHMKGKGSSGKNVGKSHMDKGKCVKVGGGGNSRGVPTVQVTAGGLPDTMNSEISKKLVVNNSRNQTGKVAKDLGNLDLNVEFSNEVEEPAPGFSIRNRAGNREEDGIEGTGFFEGLDEFLSSLPILSVVGHDKVKAT